MVGLSRIIFDSSIVEDLGSASIPNTAEDLYFSYRWDTLQKKSIEDDGITVIPESNWPNIDDISSILTSLQIPKPFLAERPLAAQSEQTPISVSPDSTNTVDINAINRAYRKKLSEDTASFVHYLVRTDFEDGMENDLTKEVKGFIQDNAFATYSWLNHIYSNNQKNEDVIAGLLRIIAMDVEVEDYDDLLPIVKAGLNDCESKAQEAAVMVIEKWRSKNCLEALQTANIQTAWIKAYAKKVETELVKELGNVS